MPAAPTLPALTNVRRIQLADVDAVLAVEVTAYSFPWTRGNFADSLAAGYFAELQCATDGKPLAYYVAMPGVEEMHLLNITTAPAHQGQGWGRAMLRRLYTQAHAQGARTLWLEVRRGNERAQRLYLAEGFKQQGLRRAYYPAAAGQREDALVLMRPLGQDATP